MVPAAGGAPRRGPKNCGTCGGSKGPGRGPLFASVSRIGPEVCPVGVAFEPAAQRSCERDFRLLTGAAMAIGVVVHLGTGGSRGTPTEIRQQSLQPHRA